MKDKKCNDFVFMPVKDGSRPTLRGDPRDKGPAKDKGATGSDSNLASGGVTEVRSKIIVVGACGCGKTALIHRYVRDRYTEVSATCSILCLIIMCHIDLVV